LHLGKQEGNIVEVLAQYLQNSKFEVAARGHRVICDQPLDNGPAWMSVTKPVFGAP
jgi:hypothetical protein